MLTKAPKIRPWIKDLISSKSGIGHLKWKERELIGHIDSIQWLLETRNIGIPRRETIFPDGCDGKLIISDTQYTMICYLRPRAIGDNHRNLYRKYTMLNIEKFKVKINKSLNNIYLIINECYFHSVIPIYPKQINYKSIKELIKYCRKGTIFEVNHLLYIKGKQHLFSFPLHELKCIYLVILYQIYQFRLKLEYLNRNKKDMIQKHFIILSETTNSIKKNDENVKELRIFYGLEPDITRSRERWSQKLGIPVHALSKELDQRYLIQYEFDKNDLFLCQNQEKNGRNMKSKKNKKKNRKRSRDEFNNDFDKDLNENKIKKRRISNDEITKFKSPQFVINGGMNSKNGKKQSQNNDDNVSLIVIEGETEDRLDLFKQINVDILSQDIPLTLYQNGFCRDIVDGDNVDILSQDIHLTLSQHLLSRNMYDTEDAHDGDI